jgi:hypothetical protein
VLCSVALAQIQAKKTATGSEQTPQKTTAIRTAVPENNGTHVAGSPKPHAMLFPVTDDGQGDPSYTAPADDRVVDPNECATAPVITGDPNNPVGIDIYLPCTGTYNVNDPYMPGACIGDGGDPPGEYYFNDSEWLKVIVPAGRTIMYVDDCAAPAGTGHAWPASPDGIFQVVSPKVGSACVSGYSNWNYLGCFNDNGCPNPPGSAYPYLERGTYNVVPGGAYWIMIARWPTNCDYTNTGWYRVTVRFGVACAMTCDPNAANTFAEREYAPGDMSQHINDGCFGTGALPAFAAIRCNEAVCGSSWYFDATSHDEDWYRLIVPGTSNVKLDWYAKAQFKADLKILRPGTTDPNNPCTGYTVVAQNDPNAFITCNSDPNAIASHAIVASTPPGEYYLTIAPTADTPGGFIYSAKVTETPCTVAHGACCDATNPSNPTCSVTIAANCTGTTKHYWGDGTICPPDYGCWVCPPGANISPEGVCSDGYVDTYDPGCAAGDSPLVPNELVCGQTWCGTSGTFVTGGSNARDNDWYFVDLTYNGSNPVWTAPADPNVYEARKIDIFVYAEFDAEVLIWDFLDPQNPCAGTVDPSVDVFAKAGEPIEFSFCKTKVADLVHAWGDFFIVVRPAFFGTSREYPCGSHYWIQMQCASQCDPGACCLPSDDCIEEVSAEVCGSLGGTFQGTGTTCFTANCPPKPIWYPLTDGLTIQEEYPFSTANWPPQQSSGHPNPAWFGGSSWTKEPGITYSPTLQGWGLTGTYKDAHMTLVINNLFVEFHIKKFWLQFDLYQEGSTALAWEPVLSPGSTIKNRTGKITQLPGGWVRWTWAADFDPQPAWERIQFRFTTWDLPNSKVVIRNLKFGTHCQGRIGNFPANSGSGTTFPTPDTPVEPDFPNPPGNGTWFFGGTVPVEWIAVLTSHRGVTGIGPGQNGNVVLKLHVGNASAPLTKHVWVRYDAYMGTSTSITRTETTATGSVIQNKDEGTPEDLGEGWKRHTVTFDIVPQPDWEEITWTLTSANDPTGVAIDNVLVATECAEQDGCCYPDGSCAETTLADCTGTWQGQGTHCVANPCANGACCYPDGSCAETTPADCTGDWQGPGTHCDPNPCALGACCDAVTGACSVVLQTACTGPWQLGVSCDPNPCCPGDPNTFCDSFAVPENEANCGVPLDTVDGGCNFTPAKLITLPSSGATICGNTAIIADPNDPGHVLFDTDWYWYHHIGVGKHLVTFMGAQFDGRVYVFGPYATANTTQLCDPNDTTAGWYWDFANCDFAGVYDPNALAGHYAIIVIPNQNLGLLTCGTASYELIVASGLPGACCILDPNNPPYCVETYGGLCTDVGGTFKGEGVLCSSSPCNPTGACCTPAGGCTQTLQVNCLSPNVWHGEWTSCSPNNCPQAPTGACCSTTGVCSVITQAACTGAGGHYYGNGTACRTGGGCPKTCKGDMNCDGRVTFVDIDLFVAALAGESHWTHWPCPWINADCNNTNSVNFTDIDPFVAVIGTTCLP